MNIFKKLFCLHKWKSHAQQKYTAKQYSIRNNIYFENGITKNFNREILICNICGKIKQIEY